MKFLPSSIYSLTFSIFIFKTCSAIEIGVGEYTAETLAFRMGEEDATGKTEITVNIHQHPAITADSIGRGIDTFLGPRPWWYVVNEPYRWRKEGFHILLRRYDEKFINVFQHISITQYPGECEQSLLRTKITGGFDSFGNNFFNYVSSKQDSSCAVFIPYILPTEAITFLDEKTCIHTHNKFECAFIPASNCSLPSILTNGKHLEEFFSNAGRHGTVIKHNEFNNLKENHKLNTRPTGPQITGTKSYGLFAPVSKLETVKTSSDPYNILFGYGFLYRPNHHFRSLIAHIIQEWKKKQDLPFPTNGDCVAVRIRRGDRTVGDRDIHEWCRQHVIYPNGSCLNDETGIVDGNAHCVRYLDMGCQTGMPFAAVTLEHTLKAARAISQSKNVLVGCDDAEWLKNQIKITQTDLNIFPFTAPPNHRHSTNGGAHYMAAIELASQCSSLVGHTGSAVTQFFYNIMCVRHANKIGVCPPLYDFSGA
eukprot:gene9812-20410_t